MKKLQAISDIIQERRSVYPQFYTQEKIDRETIEELLFHANFAPTHKLTQPWRFKVITDEKRATFGDLLAQLYKQNTPKDMFQERKQEKKALKPRQSSHIIAICMQRDTKERVPRWEEIAATAMAVQNIMLLASAYKIGSYWSSPKDKDAPACSEFLQLKTGESCLGFLYLGYHKMPPIEASRTPIKGKTQWL